MHRPGELFIGSIVREFHDHNARMLRRNRMAQLKRRLVRSLPAAFAAAAVLLSGVRIDDGFPPARGPAQVVSAPVRTVGHMVAKIDRKHKNG